MKLRDLQAGLPDIIPVVRGAVHLARGDEGLVLGVTSAEASLIDLAAAEALGVHLPLEKSEDAYSGPTAGTPEGGLALFDLALVRSASRIRAPHTKSEGMSGAMVALVAPDELVAGLKAAGLMNFPDAPEVHHITLAYLGKAAELDASTRDRINEVVTQVASRHPALTIEVGGIGMFAPGPDGYPVYASATGPGLSQLQAELEREISVITDLPSQHGWVPHMTLGYLRGDVEIQALATDTKLSWVADQVSTHYGEEAVAQAPLGAPSPTAQKFAKSNDERRVIYYVVTAPGIADSHGHTMTEEEIELGCWTYPRSMRIKLEHGRDKAMSTWKAQRLVDDKGYLTGLGAEVVENYLTYSEIKEGDEFRDGLANQDIPKGSHIAAIRYAEPIWPEMRDTPHGISWGGLAAEREVPVKK